MSKEAILAVLKRAAEDESFLAQLADDAAGVLTGYDLTSKEKAALASGDIVYIEANVGKLDQRLSTWLRCRLEQEKWQNWIPRFTKTGIQKLDRKVSSAGQEEERT